MSPNHLKREDEYYIRLILDMTPMHVCYHLIKTQIFFLDSQSSLRSGKEAHAAAIFCLLTKICNRTNPSIWGKVGADCEDLVRR